jgi:sulfate adenylyltransferase subunit 2
MTRVVPAPGTHLRQLESEAIFVLREVAAQFVRPLLLFSGGKDSIALVHLAQKAFAPAPLPFPLLHVDTGHNFAETIAYRDRFVAARGLVLHTASVQDAIDRGRVHEGPGGSRNRLQSVPLLDALAAHGADAALGGARRDEDPARSKERVFSHRDRFGGWDPQHQRPELWDLYQGRQRPGEHFRVFPLSNWTERDVWSYAAAEAIELPSLYFAHRREVVWRDGMWLARSPWLALRPGERWQTRTVRFRTVGDATCTGAFESTAANVADVLAELATSRVSERGQRQDDRATDAAMEDRKKVGYF